MSILRQDGGMAALRRFVDRETLFAFDLDGTLAPIRADAGSIRVSRVVRNRLADLMALGRMIVITGRSGSDALRHLGIRPHHLIGNHGAEGLPGQEDAEAAYASLTRGWETQLVELAATDAVQGIVVENKGPTLAVHYRAAVDRRAAHARIRAAIRRLLPPPRVVSGKCVENLIPEGAPNKGEALLFMMRHFGLPKGFFIGDDETDEDVFRLTGERVFTVRVGAEKQSGAGYALRRQQDVPWLLQEIVQTLRLRDSVPSGV